MRVKELRQAEKAAVEAARAAGALMLKNFQRNKRIDSEHQYDIKLELDVRCQKLIEKTLAKTFSEIAVLGEEGETGAAGAPYRWVVDPIDGTVNFAYKIPHASVSIALQRKAEKKLNSGESYETVVGVVLDPFADELWTALRGQPARLDGKVIHVSSRKRLQESLVSVGFAKYTETLDEMLPKMNALVRRVRKIRIMGSAALAMTYVASGRFDAYVEGGVSLWDVAAGGLILECAGGDYWRQALKEPHRFRILASNGLVRKEIERVVGPSPAR